MIKAAFFDVDGTLMSHRTRSVSESTRRSIKLLQKAGIQCVVATGRHILQMDKLPMSGIKFDGYVTVNGQLLLDGQRKVIYGAALEGEGKACAIRLFENRNTPALLMEENKIYLNFVNEDAAAVQKAISSPIPPVGEYTGGEIYQICPYFFGPMPADVAACQEHCVVTRWGGDGGVDVIATGGGKVSGLKAYLERCGITREEIIVFGDGENDLEMIRYAGIGVAMGNGVESVKEAADYVTADIDDDGIEKALIHFGLI